MKTNNNGDAAAVATPTNVSLKKTADIVTNETGNIQPEPGEDVNTLPHPTTNVFIALNRIMREVEAIGKNKENKQQNFVYRGIDDMYNELHPLFAKHGVIVIPEVIESWSEDRTTKSGTQMIYRLQKIRFTFYGPDGSHVSATVQGEANDSGDKASNKSLAIALKYVLMITFLIPTEELTKSDPDQYATGDAGTKTATAKQIQEPTTDQKVALMNSTAPLSGNNVTLENSQPVDPAVLARIAAAKSIPELGEIWNDHLTLAAGNVLFKAAMTKRRKEINEAEKTAEPAKQ